MPVWNDTWNWIKLRYAHLTSCNKIQKPQRECWPVYNSSGRSGDTDTPNRWTAPDWRAWKCWISEWYCSKGKYDSTQWWYTLLGLFESVKWTNSLFWDKKKL